MTRELNILKAVLLLRKVNTYQTKEKQIDEVNRYYMSDESLQEWIDSLKEELSKSQEQVEAEAKERIERLCEAEAEQARQEMESDMYDKEYGPSNPWDAPGMCINDFI